MHQIPGTNLAFIHIPKTAGMSVRKALGMKTSVAAHSVSSEEDEKLMAPEFIRFCVVRHPIRRFISAYLYNLYYAEQNPTGIRGEIKRVGAMSDINVFIEAAKAGDVKLGRYDHSRTQISYIKQAKPQIILKHENLSEDIKIIGRLIGMSNVELPTQNTSSERAKKLAHANTEITEDNMEFLKKFYRSDMTMFGYKD